MNQPISDIRLLPMGKALFNKNEEVIHFLSKDLKENGGRYYYRRRSIVYKDGLLILFQFNGGVVASALMIGQSDEGILDHCVEYKGHYLFDMNTMKIYDKPITANEIRNFVPDFNGFNQSTKHLSLDCLPLLDL